ncbi:MAG: hypothetical protein ABH858_06430 [Candidatus Omnitrophota bacterium]
MIFSREKNGIFTKKCKRKGFFLVFSLWLFFLLAVFCLGLGFRTLIVTRKTKLFLNRMRAHYLALSGVKLGRTVLASDEQAADYLREEWANQIEEEVIFSSPKRTGKFTVMIEDETSRIRILDTKENLLTQLLERQGVEDAAEKVDYILDYIDSDGERRQSESEDNVKNEDFSVPEELLLIKKISGPDYESLKDYVTIFGDESDKLNINTVKSELFDILIEDDNLRNDVLSVRLGPNLVEGDEDDGYYGDGGTGLPEGLDTVFTTSSNIFRITAQGEAGTIKKKITCIINKDSGKIIYWHEN